MDLDKYAFLDVLRHPHNFYLNHNQTQETNLVPVLLFKLPKVIQVKRQFIMLINELKVVGLVVSHRQPKPSVMLTLPLINATFLLLSTTY